MFRTVGLLSFLLLTLPVAVAAQRPLVSLSEAEVEDVRESSPEPARRVTVYQAIVDRRVKRIQDVLADTRGQGRAQDIHQSMEDIAGLITEVEDNLTEYGKAHRDLRKVLPKLSDAITRWESVLKQPPDNDAYTLTRKLALEAVADLRDETKEMLLEQKTYFKDHPPSKEGQQDLEGSG